MPADWFEQLAQTEVPEVPESLTGDVHQRVNRWLLVLHVCELVTRVMPYAMFRLIGGLYGLVVITLTGRHADPAAKPPHRNSP